MVPRVGQRASGVAGGIAECGGDVGAVGETEGGPEAAAALDFTQLRDQVTAAAEGDEHAEPAR
ncbi:hypothetical protein ACWDZ6_17890 [Streptomyces sp. NPDC002926]